MTAFLFTVTLCAGITGSSALLFFALLGAVDIIASRNDICH